MRKTANYQLNQWDPKDRILREEFNGDNERIDAALSELNVRDSVVKFREHVTEADADGIVLELAGIDWGAWQTVYLDIALLGDSNSAGLRAKAQLEGGGSHLSMTSSSAESGFGSVYIGNAVTGVCSQPARYIFQVGKNGAVQANATLTGCGSFASCWVSTTYNKLTKFSLGVSRGLFSAGSRFTFWGVR